MLQDRIADLHDQIEELKKAVAVLEDFQDEASCSAGEIAYSIQQMLEQEIEEAIYAVQSELPRGVELSGKDVMSMAEHIREEVISELRFM